MNSDLIITPELLTDISRRSKKTQREMMKALGKLEWERCADSLHYWLDERLHPTIGPYVFTLDPHPLYLCRLCNDQATHHFNHRADHLKLFHKIEAESEPVIRGYFIELPTTRPFPIHLYDEYMKPIIDRWLLDQFVFVEKSRDMFATWLVVSMYTWDTLFHSGRQNIFQSEDTTKSRELVERSWFLYRSQPRLLKEAVKAEFGLGSSKSGHFKVPSLNSEIIGFPQGPGQIRSLHPSGYFMDEAAFQEQAGDAFAAIKPAIQAGGRFTAISSASPGWFMLACQDRDQEAAA